MSCEDGVKKGNTEKVEGWSYKIGIKYYCMTKPKQPVLKNKKKSERAYVGDTT